MHTFLACTCLSLAVAPPAAGETLVSAVARPNTETGNDHYVSNRPPLVANPLVKLPIGAIEPRGWLRRQLELQAAGFHGHLGEISQFLKKEGNAWLSPEGRGECGWEEVPYWLKGYSNAAYLLKNPKMLEETRVWIEAALRSQKPDGWFGPDEDRPGTASRIKGRDDLWPNMIMLFCLQDFHEATGDRRVIDLMAKYFRYLAGVPEDRFLVGYWPPMRGGDLLSSVYWLYNRTGDAGLLDLAEKVHRRTARWDEDVINWHNVNMAQAFGEPTTWFMQSKNPADLEASYRNYAKIREMYGQVPGGMFGGDENCRPGFTGPRQAIETCGMVEMMLSTERLTWITGDLVWADRCEDVAFNSLPAALTADMKALRYLTAPNLVLSDRQNKSPGFQNRGPMLHMNPHDHRCCQHNWGHGWPYLAEHLWFATPDNGLAAVFYCDSRVTVKVGSGAEVTVEENTRYPFDERVEFVVRTGQPVRFPLYLRVPGWCRRPSVAVAGKPLEFGAKPLQYVRIERQWSDGDRVQLTVPMEIRIRRWERNHNSASVDRGPLTYSLKIGEKYVREGGTDQWPAWEIHPETPWNYGLIFDEANPAASFEVVKREWPASNMPFTHEGTPIELRARGKRIPQWQLDYLGLVGPLQASPVRSDQPAEAITLIPMGAARLRVSSFPVISDGPEASIWQEPSPAPAGASHCWDGDTVAALDDELEPKTSDDSSIPRFTWWNHKGTTEWVEYTFDKPRRVSSSQVYWFDDTGRGQCRVPKSWRLLYRKGGQWMPVEMEGVYGVETDCYNPVEFSPVTTDAVRLEAQLQPELSAGILEWKVE